MLTGQTFLKIILTFVCCISIVLSSEADRTNVTVTSSNQTINNTSVSNRTIDETHLSREQVTVHEENVKPTDNNSSNANSTAKLSDVVKKYEGTFPNSTDDDKTSKPRKGVTLSTDPPTVVANNNISTNNATKSSTIAPKTSTTAKTVKSTTKPIVKKPLFTEHIEKPIVAEKSNDDNIEDKVIYDNGNKNHGKSNQADYIIPIVAVILSVPLVAIVMAYLYKRGADWYQHRNYRRMDFLIEGMYNN